MPHDYQAQQRSSIRTATRLNFQCRKNSPSEPYVRKLIFYKRMAQEFNNMFKFFIVDAPESRNWLSRTLSPTFKYFIMAKYSNKASEKVEDTMHEMKRGKLKSGRSGKKVTSRKQAIAIGLSEARKEGAKVPKKKGAAKKGTPKKGVAKKSASRRSGGRKSARRKTATRR